MNTGRLFMNIDLETLSQGKYQGRPLTDTDEYIPRLRIGLKRVVLDAVTTDCDIGLLLTVILKVSK